MAKQKIERKIAVLFATDVVGYSKHIETDESETIHNLRECEDLLTELFEKHEGRLFNTGGDSFLAEFPSAVAAVECAVEFQNSIKKRNNSKDASVKLEFRIGINSGDVVKEKDNLLGDGVNIAARLEALAQVGGITISKSVHDFVKGKTKFEFNDLGIQKVKQNEFHAFDLLLETSQKRTFKPKAPSGLIYTVIACIFCIVAGGMYYLFNVDGKINSNQQEVTSSQQKSSSPIILVEPFKIIGGSTEDISMGVGFTESMISTLSQFNGVTVLSSNVSFHVEDNNFSDVEKRDLYNIDYTVQGSIQIAGGKSRITVNLNDLEQKKIVWSEKTNFDLQNIFEVQDDIGNQILSELQINTLAGSDGERWAENFESFETYTDFLNFWSLWREHNPQSYTKAEKVLRRLEAKIPDSAVTNNLKAWQTIQKLWLGLSKDIDNDKRNLTMFVDKAIALRGNHEDYAVKSAAELFHLSNDCQVAVEAIMKAFKLGFNVDTLNVGGSVLQSCGDLEGALKYAKKALSLTPNDPNWITTQIIVSTLYKMERYEEIIEVAGKNIHAPDMSNIILAIYSVVEYELGNKESANNIFKLFKLSGTNRDEINSWFPTSDTGQRLISELEKIGPLD